MDENQALLGKEFDGVKQDRFKRYVYQDEYSEDARGSSSDESQEWWGESHSSCGSSCCSSSGSSLVWEREVDDNGELFYIESDVCELPVSPTEDKEPFKVEVENSDSNIETDKKGKLARWMRRRQSKRQRPKLTVLENVKESVPNPPPNLPGRPPNDRRMKQIVVKLDAAGTGEIFSEKILGLIVTNSTQDQKIIITGFTNSGKTKWKEIAEGDVLRSINDEDVSPHNFENVLRSLILPTEIVVQVESGGSEDEGKRNQSALVKRLVEKDRILESLLEDQPVGLVFINTEKQTSDKKDIVYSFPSKSDLSSSRGSFVTLYHLLSEILTTNQCRSSSVLIKKMLSHVIYKAEDNYLLLIAVPDSRCGTREAENIVNDLVRCLTLSHQSLHRCFTTCSATYLNHFFSVFFSRILSDGFAPDNTRSVVLESIPAMAAESSASQFEDILPYAHWIPLPREAQIQLDDALNELEANDIDYIGEDSIDNQRLYNIIGSCFYHKGYLLASHLPKDDLLDVHSFCRQNCLLQLIRTESVKSLIIWREVFPMSVNRGVPITRTNGYPLPKGRWFLLLVGQGQDLLAVVLESGDCCAKADPHPGPSIEYIEETEDTLRHIQRLGITNLASQWLKDNVNCRTITPDDVFNSKTNRKKENLLSFVRTSDAQGKQQGTPPSSNKFQSDGNQLRNRISQSGENSEDSISQAPSNVSEVSDENAPILGRRAERVKNALLEQESDSENSDSDWESFKESNRQDLNSSGGSSAMLRGFSLTDMNDVIPSKLTTGLENVLFHYVHLDSNEGVFMCPTTHSKESSGKMKEILDQFRKSALLIHSLLENNVRFKKSSQDTAKCLINKSLIAVKEHGILLECSHVEQDTNKRISFAYWVVGRLFFTPQPREVYVCYHDEAPQNLVEIAFRLGLNAAG